MLQHQERATWPLVEVIGSDLEQDSMYGEAVRQNGTGGGAKVRLEVVVMAFKVVESPP